MKKFLITIDTEGDNLWQWHKGDNITTECVKYLPRFQNLCERYGFKPVYLSNYEMIDDDDYVAFIKDVCRRNCGELGMHLHAWNSPPDYELPTVRDSQPYLIEYPVEVMEDKIRFITRYIQERTGIRPISHRSGRWALNQDYIDLLIKYGYKVDCSVTPHIDWKYSLGCTENSQGSNYMNSSEHPYVLKSGSGDGAIWEVPVTIRICNNGIFKHCHKPMDIAKGIYHIWKKRPYWIRPNGHNLDAMKHVVDQAQNDNYIMFMLHSSEMMPGGSPNFLDKNSIEKLYDDMEAIFSYLHELKYEGGTLQEYYYGYGKEIWNDSLVK